MKFTTDDILALYRDEAARHGEGATSTIQDARTRQLELQALFSYFKDGLRVLEVGCGNGFVAQTIVEHFDLDLDAIDLSQDMIAIAEKRDLSKSKGRASFRQADVTKYRADKTYDLVFTERCIQNLLSWEDQQIAIRILASALRPGGQFVMLESFWTGLNNLNAARAELGIEAIAESWHNNFFHEDETVRYARTVGLEYVDQNRFLSGYYFGSRLLLPALLPAGKKANSSSVLNDYFCALPPAGDFSPMKVLRFRKSRS